MKISIYAVTSFVTLVWATPNDVMENVAQDFMDLPESVNARMLKRFNRNEAQNDLSTLKYVSVITRHGSRSPTSTYPKDPYPFTDLRFWPDGPGQLTRLGKQQLFRTGRILRRRYDGFLNINYFPNDTSVRSNPYDRDFMSAACLLAALYPPVGYQIWNRKINWQPVPIWEDRYDVAEIVSKRNLCPRFGEELDKSLAELDKDSANHKELFAYLSDHTGIKINRISRIIEIWDILELQKENGYKLPAWAKKVYPHKLQEMEGIAFRAYVGGTHLQTRLVAGPVLEMILDQLNEKSRGAMRPNRKMYILAAHDITLRALLSGLSINDAFPIDTSAFMVFELHENSAGHNVRALYYNNSLIHTPTVLKFPSCHDPCSLTDFNAMVMPFIPKNWREECHNVTTSSTDES